MTTSRLSNFTYTVKRTNRVKTATIQIESGKVVVSVPSRLSDSKVDALIASRSEWIEKKVSDQFSKLPRATTEFVSGQGLMYLGRNYRLKVYRSGVGTTGLRNGRIEVWVPDETISSQDTIKGMVEIWYKTRAEEKFKERVRLYERVVGSHATSIAVKDMRTKWGTCTALGRVTLNWRLIFAPIRIIDYVIVNELCHLLYHDHSRKFWSAVVRVIPDYESRKHWLKTNGLSLNF
jgi:predicted metal-dependent hydrolase